MENRVLTFDDIAVMSDDELFGRVRSARNQINRLRSDRVSTHDLEVDLCYLIREVEIRDARRVAYQKRVETTRRR